MGHVESLLACAICGRSPDGGHMVEPCTNEEPWERKAREEREAKHLPTKMPEPAPGLVHASPCCGCELEPDKRHPNWFWCSSRTCESPRPVARLNERTNRREWLNGALPTAPEDAPLQSFGAKAGGSTPRDALEKLALSAGLGVYMGEDDVLKAEVERADGEPAWFRAVMWVSRG